MILLSSKQETPVPDIPQEMALRNDKHETERMLRTPTEKKRSEYWETADGLATVRESKEIDEKTRLGVLPSPSTANFSFVQQSPARRRQDSIATRLSEADSLNADKSAKAEPVQADSAAPATPKHSAELLDSARPSRKSIERKDIEQAVSAEQSPKRQTAASSQREDTSAPTSARPSFERNSFEKPFFKPRDSRRSSMNSTYAESPDRSSTEMKRKSRRVSAIATLPSQLQAIALQARLAEAQSKPEEFFDETPVEISKRFSMSSSNRMLADENSIAPSTEPGRELTASPIIQSSAHEVSEPVAAHDVRSGAEPVVRPEDPPALTQNKALPTNPASSGDRAAQAGAEYDAEPVQLPQTQQTAAEGPPILRNIAPISSIDLTEEKSSPHAQISTRRSAKSLNTAVLATEAKQPNSISGAEMPTSDLSQDLNDDKKYVIPPAPPSEQPAAASKPLPDSDTRSVVSAEATKDEGAEASQDSRRSSVSSLGRVDKEAEPAQGEQLVNSPTTQGSSSTPTDVHPTGQHLPQQDHISTLPSQSLPGSAQQSPVVYAGQQQDDAQPSGLVTRSSNLRRSGARRSSIKSSSPSQPRPLSYVPLQRDVWGVPIQENLETSQQQAAPVDISAYAGPPAGAPLYQAHPAIRQSQVQPEHSAPLTALPSARNITDEHGLEDLQVTSMVDDIHLAEETSKRNKRRSSLWDTLKRSSSSGKPLSSNAEDEVAPLPPSKSRRRSNMFTPPQPAIEQKETAKTLKKPQRATSSAATSSSEVERRRFSGLSSLFGRASTQGHASQRPNKLSKRQSSSDQVPQHGNVKIYAVPPVAPVPEPRRVSEPRQAPMQTIVVKNAAGQPVRAVNDSSQSTSTAVNLSSQAAANYVGRPTTYRNESSNGMLPSSAARTPANEYQTYEWYGPQGEPTPSQDHPPASANNSGPTSQRVQTPHEWYWRDQFQNVPQAFHPVDSAFEPQAPGIPPRNQARTINSTNNPTWPLPMSAPVQPLQYVDAIRVIQPQGPRTMSPDISQSRQATAPPARLFTQALPIMPEDSYRDHYEARSPARDYPDQQTPWTIGFPNTQDQNERPAHRIARASDLQDPPPYAYSSAQTRSAPGDARHADVLRHAFNRRPEAMPRADALHARSRGQALGYGDQASEQYAASTNYDQAVGTPLTNSVAYDRVRQTGGYEGMRGASYPGQEWAPPMES